LKESTHLHPIFSTIIVIILISTILLTSTIYVNANSIVTPEDGYGDLMQYPNLDPIGTNPERTSYNAGPAPDTPELLWQSDVTAPEISLVSSGLGAAYLVADGKFFCRESGFGANTIYALDAITGRLEWATDLPDGVTLSGFFGGDAVYRIDDTHIVTEASTGLACFNSVTGRLLWVNSNVTSGGSFAYFPFIVVPELHMFYRQNTPVGAYTIDLVGYDTSNADQCFTEVWRYTKVAAGSSPLCYGDGKIFESSTGDMEVYALDALDGTLLWETQAKNSLGYAASYSNGKLYVASESQSLTVYDAENGNVLREWVASDRPFMSYTGAVAYGRVYRHVLAVPSSYFACWDAETLELLWTAPTSYYIGYFQSVVADGKVYVTQSEASDLVPASFACYDAFTGQKLWDIPKYFANPAVAYGNLYLVADGIISCYSNVNQPAGKSPQPWSNWLGNPEQPGVVVGESAPKSISSPRWSYETGGAVTGGIAVADGKVYAGSRDQYLYCIDAYDGSFIWKFETGFKLHSGPAVVSGRVYLGPDDGNIYCLDANSGDVIWTTPAGGFIPYTSGLAYQARSSPIIVGGSLYVGSLDGKLYCLNINDGSVDWTYQTGAPITTSPTVSHGVVYIGADNQVKAISATTGNLLWSAPYNIGARSPLVVGNTVYITVQVSVSFFVSNHYLIALDGSAYGAQLWNTSISAQIMGHGNTAYAMTYYDSVIYTPAGAQVAAYSALTGENIWSKFLGFLIYPAVTVADDPTGTKVYVGSDSYSITCIDAITGESISWFTTQGQVECVPAVYDSRLYVGSADHKIYCFYDDPTAQMAATVAVDKTDVDLGDSVTVSAQLVPGLPNASMIVTFTDPDGVETNLDAVADNMGFATVTYSPKAEGNWTVIAWYEGAQYTGIKYSNAFSGQITLEVVDTTPPVPDDSVPLEYIYAAIGVIATLIIIVVAYMFLKKRK
jgi:outer membrane protein assembly factor BamB